ncbi:MULTISPECIES: TolC family protein [unclassified Wenzhouxiangella]|uniref:TolC family protein n=1 Tax=unclassified Wenzhouxiangella TaxID=2613841 RepID=UPI000E3291CA|nr:MULTISPECIES: TolC family protein [unclassified Wenzhouxiangella]RFF28020.1 TolC family protein [Wenzhouxiangella sp. 15181]RFP68606.1 TolC family protein [Wenzhouxiangella sp. 15190]
MSNGTLLSAYRSIRLARLLPCLFILLVFSTATPAAESSDESPLTLERAVSLATSAADPAVQQFVARGEALESDAVADAQLPDPMVSAQVVNVPTDTFRLDQEGMTQALRLGLRQEIPPGRTLDIRSRQRSTEAGAERAQTDLALRRIALETRQAWFELAWQDQAVAVLRNSRNRIEQQIESLQSRFAAGGLHSQALLRTELELSLLDDRIAEHRRMADRARAALSRYIGSDAYRPLPEQLPDFEATSTDLDELQDQLVSHPAVEAKQARIEAAELGIELAEQAYKPRLAIEAGYGLRSERPDLASIGVTLSLPLFAENRQDKRHTAAVQRSSAAQFDRDALLLDLKRQLEQAVADWQRYRQRLDLYEKVVAERARDTVEASVTTYANGQTDFAELIRSQLADLEAQIKRAELQARAGAAWAQILYLAGETS